MCVFLLCPFTFLFDTCVPGKQVVDLIITELAVFTVDDNGLTLIEHAEGVSVEDIKVRNYFCNVLIVTLRERIDASALRTLRCLLC